MSIDIFKIICDVQEKIKISDFSRKNNKAA
jgi:hypothetical protein